MSTPAPATQHVFRQRSALGLATLGGLTAVLVLVSLVRNWAEDPQPLAASWVLLLSAVVWATFVRPAVLLDLRGVTLRNVLRDVHIPWERLTDVGCRWNLKVFVEDRGYTAWAISSQVERPKGAPGGMFSILPGRLDAIARSQPSTSSPKVTGPLVAQSIRQAKQEYDEAVTQGQLPAAPDAVVRTTWVPWVLALVLLPTIAVVALTLG